MEENQIEVQNEPNKKNNLLIWGGVLLIGLLLVGGIYMSNSKNGSTNTITETREANTEEDQQFEENLNPSGSMTEDGPEEITAVQQTNQVIEVEGGMFYFNPNEIIVKKDTPVRIVFNNAEGMHDFVIDELGVKTKIIQAGQTETVEFTPKETGTFEFYCSVANHREQGMKGTLVVQ